jgi:hypothetical protein
MREAARDALVKLLAHPRYELRGSKKYVCTEAEPQAVWFENRVELRNAPRGAGGAPDAVGRLGFRPAVVDSLLFGARPVGRSGNRSGRPGQTTGGGAGSPASVQVLEPNIR